MSLYPPPTSNVQIFNPSLFTNSIQGGGLGTVGTGGSYLSYPVAQGAETFIGPLNTLTLDASGIALGVIVSAVQQGIAMNGTGFAWNNGTSLATITWQTLADRIQYANAISQPTNATTLNVNNTVRIQNGETTTSPTPYVDIIAGATTSISLVGNKGTAGQVLTSGGPSGSLTWGSGGGGSVGTLQDVINNSPNLQGTPPTTSQVIQYNGTNPVWATLPAESQNLQSVLTSGNITDKQMIFRTDPLVSQLTVNTTTDLITKYENFTASGSFPGSKTTNVTPQKFQEQMFISGVSYNSATMEVEGDPTVSTSNLKSQVTLLEENTASGKNVTTTIRPMSITQVNTGATASNFTVTTDSQFLVSSDNFTVGASSIGLPSATANLTITPSSITYTNPSVPTAPFFISSQNDFTVASDNFDLSNLRMTMPNIASPSYMDFDSATGKMTLQNANAGGGLAPQLVLTNTNATGSVVQEVYKNKPTPALAGDILHSLLVYGKDAANTKQEYGRILFSTRDNTSGTEDGSIDFGCTVAGTPTSFLQINGIENEVNMLKTLDMGGNQIRTNTGDLTLSTAVSTGAGVITLQTKSGGFINFPSLASSSNYVRVTPQSTANSNRLEMSSTEAGTNFRNGIDLMNNQYAPQIELKADFSTGGAINKSINIVADGIGGFNKITAYDGQTNNPFQIDTSGYTNGSIEMKVNDATGDLIFTGTNIQSGSSSGSSGQHLRIKLNGVYYKIGLDND